MKVFNFLYDTFRKKQLDVEEIERLRNRAGEAFKLFAQTEGGKAYLEYMYYLYCDKPCLEDTPEKTYANLAQKELVENLIKFSSIENQGENTNE